MALTRAELIAAGVEIPGSSSAESFIPTGSTAPTNGLYLSGTNTVALSTNGVGRVFVDASGNVGIAQPTPTADLHVYSGANAVVRIEDQGEYLDLVYNDNGSTVSVGVVNADNGNSSVASTELRIGVDSESRYVIYGDGTHQFLKSGGVNEALRITSDGKVGIGESNPAQTLHVKGAGAAIRVDNTDAGANVYGDLINAVGGTTTLRARGGASTHGSISLNTWDGTTDSSRLFIDSAGKVGIGTTNPGAQLDITGISGTYPTQQIKHSAIETEGEFLRIARTDSSNIRYHSVVAKHSGSYDVGTNYIQFKIHDPSVSTTAQNTILHLDGTGRVGVGTTNPSALLDVQGNGTVNSIEATSTGNCVVRMTASNASGCYLQMGDPDDTNIGFIQYYNPGNSMSFTVNAQERLRIDSSGRLLVGHSVSFSGYQLESLSTTGAAAALSQFSANAQSAVLRFNKSRGSLGSQGAVIANDDIGYIDFRGSDGSNLVQAVAIVGEVDGTPGTNDIPGRLMFLTRAAGASSPTERMRITNAGNILFNSTSTSTSLGGADANAFRWLATGATGTNRFAGYLESNAAATALNINQTYNDANTRGAITFYRTGVEVGSVSVSTTATAYNTSSDYRLKENVTAVTDGIARLQQLKPSRFNFIADPGKTVDGFLAHEVQAVVPEAITGEKDAVDDGGNPVYQGIDQSKLVPLLTAALQEAIGEIESLKARLTAAGI